MRRPTPVIVLVTLAAFLAACSNENDPYLKIGGGGFIFNYRLANAMLGVLVVAPRSLPEGGTVEVSLTNPAGGAPLVQREVIAANESQFDFRFETLTGIEKNVDYVATVRLIGADGKTIETIERVYRSDIDQAATMPDKPLTVGPGYTPNPETSH